MMPRSLQTARSIISVPLPFREIIFSLGAWASSGARTYPALNTTSNQQRRQRMFPDSRHRLLSRGNLDSLYISNPAIGLMELTYTVTRLKTCLYRPSIHTWPDDLAKYLLGALLRCGVDGVEQAHSRFRSR